MQLVKVNVVIAFIIGVITVITAQRNNVCKTIKDYKSMDVNPNCRYEFAINASVPEIIQNSGRRVEIHNVTTPDGHILTIFRIPNNKKRNPVFLQHGLFTTSANWISLGEASLAFQLHNKGYDVWLGNYRGTHYSQEHVRYTISDTEFWDHGLDELSLFDLPTMLKYVSKTIQGGGKIIYICHSMGGTFSLMYMSEKVDEAAKLIKMQILTAPAHKLANMRASIRFLVPFADVIYKTVNQFEGLSNVISKESTSNSVLKTLCMDSPEMMNQCMSMIFLIYGPKTSIYPDKYPMFFQQHLAGTAFKVIRHLSDMPKNYFRKFDYGSAKNMQLYGRHSPPDYDVSKIRVPSIVIFAKNDWLTAKQDAINLYRELSPEYRKGLFEINEENFNHIDYMFGASAKHLYIDKVLILLDRMD